MLSLWVIRRSLHIDKVHTNNNSFLIIPTVSLKSYFVDSIAHLSGQRKDNSSEIHAHGIYRSVKRFLQPAKLLEISIIMRSWKYYGLRLLFTFIVRLTMNTFTFYFLRPDIAISGTLYSLQYHYKFQSSGLSFFRTEVCVWSTNLTVLSTLATSVTNIKGCINHKNNVIIWGLPYLVWANFQVKEV